MNLLLDTHTFLWWVTDDERLSTKARRAVADPRNRVLFSVVSAWEIAVKARAGRLTLAVPVTGFVAEQLRRNPFEVLPLALSHVLRSDALPAHHADPFDRLLVAQALEEDATIVSGDRLVARYPVKRRW